MKIATTFCKKIEFTPFSKKTHPKFKEFLNVLYLQGFFKKVYQKKENENRHPFLQKNRIYTLFQKNASKVQRIPKCFVSSRVFQKSVSKKGK
jgi:hypothetical protein